MLTRNDRPQSHQSEWWQCGRCPRYTAEVQLKNTDKSKRLYFSEEERSDRTLMDGIDGV